MQVGIDRMRGEFGDAFDRDYVNTLRKAHAKALIPVSTVRADTRNTLEQTGDVDYAQLPVPGSIGTFRSPSGTLATCLAAPLPSTRRTSTLSPTPC